MKTTRWLAVAALVAGGTLVGCGGRDSSGSIEAAKTYLARGETKASIIESKNALQADPGSAEARYLLGKALLDGGDPVSATLELQKARALKDAPAATRPALMQALTAVGKYQEALDLDTADATGDPTVAAAVKTAAAAAQLRLGKRREAELAIAAALQLSPAYNPARTLQARLLAAEGRMDEAFVRVDDVLRTEPTETDALMLRGDLLQYARGDVPAALASYRAALKARGSLVVAHAAILTLLVATKDFDGAAKQLADFKKQVPGHGEAKYFDGLLAFHHQDYAGARQISQQLLTMAPNNVKAMYFAAAVELKNGSLLQAQNHAAKALQVLPGNASLMKLLAQVYLRAGQPAKVLATLAPYADTASADAELLALVAHGHLANGDITRAEHYFTEASKRDPADTRSRTALALTKLAAGDSQTAFDELQTISTADRGITADLALVSALLQRKEVERALKAIDAIERKDPKSPLPATLRGRIEFKRGNIPAARASFERAVALSPQYFSAVSALATLDLADHKPEEARKRFERLLVADPKNVQALLAIAQLRLTTGGSKDEVTALLSKAIQLNPAEPSARRLLVEQLIKGNDLKAAVTAGQEAVAALPGDATLVEALGRAQMAAGESNQAIVSFNRLSELLPQSEEPQLRLAEAYMAVKQSGQALQSLRRALANVPGSLAARRGMISVYMATGRSDEALQFARNLQKQTAQDPMGYVFEGDILAEQRQWDAALAAYRAGLQKQKSPALAVKLHKTLMAAGRSGEADRMAAAWIKDAPKDDVFLFYLADAALTRKEYAAAERYYADFIALRPESPIALNNLAWISASLGRPNAIGYAREANRLAPNQPSLMDTLAVLLGDQKQFDEALALQKRAVMLAPQLPALRLNLAKLLIKSGAKSEAKKELVTLSGLGDKFVGQGEVNQLLNTL